MVKTGKLAGFAVVAVLALSGCAAGLSADEAKSAPAAASSAATSAPVLTAAPAPENAVEVEFLTAVQRIPGLEDVTMGAALVVGHAVCDQLVSGADPLALAPVENGAQQDNEDMVMVSALMLCADQVDAAQQPFIDRRVALGAATVNG